MSNRRDQIRLFIETEIKTKQFNNLENEIIRKGYYELQNGKDVNRIILGLKKDLSELSFKGNLSKDGINFLSELSRREPSTSVSSMWNFLIKK